MVSSSILPSIYRRSNKPQPAHARDKKKLDNDAPPKDSGTASISNLTTSLINSIVGSGCLALPAGIATLGDSPTARILVPAILIIIVTGIINAYFFSLIGRVCALTGATGYREAWELTMGEETSQWVARAVAFKTMLSCLACSIIIADAFQSLAVAAGLTSVSRTQALFFVSLVALLPLCLLRDLTSLAFFSFLGLVGMGFTTYVMIVRYLDGTYAVDTGVFLSQVPSNMHPSFGDSGPSMTGIVLACTLATAFVAHYNAPRFHAELRDNTVKRFNIVVGLAFFMSTVVFIVVAVVGFLTFGAGSSGLILNNYSPYDPLVTASRLAVALSIVFTYPTLFVGFRDSVLDVLQFRDASERLVTILSIGLLLAVTIAAAVVTDLALVLSVGGGTFSTAVASVFPALMFRSAVKDSKDASDKMNSLVALVFMWICMLIGAYGVYVSIR